MTPCPKPAAANPMRTVQRGCDRVSGYAMEWAVDAARAKQLDRTARWVLVAMAYYASPKWGRSYASVSSLVEMTGLGERTVRRALERIRQSEVVDVTIRAGQTAIWVFPTPPRSERPGLGVIAPYARNGFGPNPGHSDLPPRSERPGTPVTVTYEQGINKQLNKSAGSAPLATASEPGAYCQPPPSTWHPAMPPAPNLTDEPDTPPSPDDRPAKADYVAVMLEMSRRHLGRGQTPWTPDSAAP